MRNMTRIKMKKREYYGGGWQGTRREHKRDQEKNWKKVQE